MTQEDGFYMVIVVLVLVKERMALAVKGSA